MANKYVSTFVPNCKTQKVKKCRQKWTAKTKAQKQQNVFFLPFYKLILLSCPQFSSLYVFAPNPQ